MPILGRLRRLCGLRKDAEKAASLIKILKEEERPEAYTEYGLLVVLIALALAALALYFLRK
ncbi:MAG: hypothetical protein WBC04_06065 [Candidatus Acidiferrales bacterium]